MSTGAAGTTADDGTEERSVPDQMAFKARALAQTHPLTNLAKRFIDRAAGEQETSEKGPDVVLWASTAMLNGYCLRRVEEDSAGLVLQAVPGVEPDLSEVDEQAARISAALRTDEGDAYALGDVDTLVTALDRIIASEVEKRLDQTNTGNDRRARAELGEFMTWWVLKGYALRVAEGEAGAVA